MSATSRESDTELIARIRAGDQLALRALYARHNVKVFRFALRLLRSEPSAEDVVSEVFTDVWRNPANFEGRSEASTWLLAMTRNKAYSILRRKREKQLDEDAAAETEDLEPESKAYARARRLRANWMAARVTKAVRVSARFS
jgi:RNA polymerase sigma-70 factor (ECF subfamily)